MQRQYSEKEYGVASVLDAIIIREAFVMAVTPEQIQPRMMFDQKKLFFENIKNIDEGQMIMEGWTVRDAEDDQDEDCSDCDFLNSYF